MEAIINQFIKAIGWSILHSLWQGAIIFALLSIILSASAKMSAKLKHNLSMAALFLIFMSFCLTFAWLFNLPVKTAATLSDTTLKATTIPSFYHYTRSWNFITERYFPPMVMLYVTGIVFQLVVLITGYLKLKRLKHTYITAFPTEWLKVAEQTLHQLNIGKQVKFYLSERVNVPLSIGFLKPVVLFPVALVAQLDLQQVEAILIHELSHIRRNDYLLNLMKTGIETLLFFNPFVWLTSRFVHIEREHACDDLVVKLTGAPVTYAHALLKLELIKDKKQPALSLAATGKNQYLYQRIKRITNMKTNYMNAKQRLLALCLTLATIVSLAWISPGKKENATTPKQRKTTVVKVISNTAVTNHQLVCLKTATDTAKKKIKREIIIKSKDGKKTVYNSIAEMPDSLKVKLADIEKTMNAPEWQEKLNKIQLNGEEMAKMFNTKEWKDKIAGIEWKMDFPKMLDGKEFKKLYFFDGDSTKQLEFKGMMEQLRKNSEELKKQFNSPEWKDKMAKIEFNTKGIENKFNSPEWKAQIEVLKKNSEEMKKQFKSEEWKKKMEELKEFHQSKEYKELRKKYEKDLEKLKKKKGINTEKAFLITDEALPTLYVTALN